MKKILVPFMACTLLVASLYAEVYEVSKSSPMTKLAPKPLVRDNAKEVVIDPKTKLMWQDDVDTQTVKKDWHDAQVYCNNLQLLSFNDWRLPTKSELQDLYAKKSSLKNTTSNSYWSATTYEGSKYDAWFVDFYDGYVYYHNLKYSSYYVRCVRGGQ